MNKQRTRDGGDLALDGRPGQQRHDLRQRDIVNHAILVQESANTVSAIEYLKSHEVAPGIIERVLLEPGRRRKLLCH
jgi:hypothetical protein